MTSADRNELIYISPAYERIWGQSCDSLLESRDSWMASIHPEDQARVRKAVAHNDLDQYNIEYRIVRQDGSTRWIHDRAFPIKDQQGRIYRIAGIAEDITEPKLTELALLEISDREQARIGQDLHDGLCQLLVSIAFDCNLLEQRLSSAQRPEQAELSRIATLLDEAITQARQLARGLYPVRLEAEGLTSALEELAANVTTRFKIQCDFQRSDPVSFNDNVMATHLFRIAQEAVTNAVRHSQAGHIVLRLTRLNGNVEMVVTDDGIGMPERRNGRGMGLQIMDYRARTLGGTLQIQRINGGGTSISCSVPLPSPADLPA
jgi:two-component system sensor kinase FixL